MKILLICHEIPSMSVGATLPFYHMIRNISKMYDMHLVCFNSGKYQVDPLKEHLEGYDMIDIVEYETFMDQFKYTLSNMLSFNNLKKRSFFNYYYNKQMAKTIDGFIDENDFDMIITDMPMAFYVKNTKIPKIIYAFDAVGEYNHEMYKKADTLTSKLYWYLNYLKIHNYEKAYNKFNCCIVVNEKDKINLQKHIKTPIEVVANGVDVNFFKQKTSKKTRKLVFTGDMSTPPNNDAIRYFMDEIYPLIQKEVTVPLEIVGRNPTDYIKSLTSDNVNVTGSVSDVRDYLTPGSVFITPMVSGTGIKNKILEAMSMNLSCICTKTAISGIRAVDGHDYLLADSPEEFKDAVIRLLSDDNLNHNIAENARVFVKNNYSWNIATNKLVNIIEKYKT